MTVRIRSRRDRAGDHWQVDIRIRWPDGTEYRERVKAPTSSKSGAKRWGEEREGELLRLGKLTVTASETLVPTLAEFGPQFVRDYAVADGHGEGGVESKESILRLHLIPHLGTKRLNEIKDADVQRLKRIWREGVVDQATGRVLVRPTGRIKTINNRLTVLSKLLKVAVSWKESTGLAVMPCEVHLIRGTDSAEMGFYDYGEYDVLVDAAKRVGEAEHLVVLLGGDAGLRRGEILGLQQGDIVRGKLHVQRQVYYKRSPGGSGRHPVVTPTKGKHKRWVPLTVRLGEALARHRHIRAHWILAQDDGSPLTPKLLRLAIQRAERRAGRAPSGRLHVLRHTYCSHLAMAGVTVVTIQCLAGHENLETTMRYMHLAPNEVDRAIERLQERRSTEAEAAVPLATVPKTA